MKYLLIVCLLLFTFVQNAYSYPENQIKEWISSALVNPATKSISKVTLTKYCDCALKSIIDEILESGRIQKDDLTILVVDVKN